MFSYGLFYSGTKSMLLLNLFLVFQFDLFLRQVFFCFDKWLCDKFKSEKYKLNKKTISLIFYLLYEIWVFYLKNLTTILDNQKPASRQPETCILLILKLCPARKRRLEGLLLSDGKAPRPLCGRGSFSIKQPLCLTICTWELTPRYIMCIAVITSIKVAVVL